jgi:hypothetical protein
MNYAFNNDTQQWGREGMEFRSENSDSINAYSSIWVTADVSWTMTAENLAYPNPGSLNRELSSITMSMPIFMGVRADVRCNTFYLGHIAEVSIFRYSLDSLEVDCLHRDVAEGEAIGVCQEPGRMRSRAFTHTFLGTSRTELRGVTLAGDTYLDSEEGLQFDGDGDVAWFEGSWVDRYAAAASFTVSYWFTRTTCEKNEGGWVPYANQLYSHEGPNGAFINMEVICEAGRRSSVTTPDGDRIDDDALTHNILRTTMQDDAGTYAEFDVDVTDSRTIRRAGNTGTACAFLCSRASPPMFCTIL